MSSQEYDRIIAIHPRPYIVNIELANGALLLYGSEHTKDPDNPQIRDLEQRWNEFNPTVALVESRLGFFIDGISNPVLRYSEMGAVYSLARKKRVKTYTWEPNREQEVAFVLQDYPKERVALFYVLRPYFSNLRHGRPENPEEFVEEFRRKRTRYPGLENTLASIDDVDTLWKRDFPDEPDWRDTSDEYGLPGYLGEIARTSNEARDENFVRVIIHLIQNGGRVFAVAGSSHAVKLEPALRALLENQ